MLSLGILGTQTCKAQHFPQQAKRLSGGQREGHGHLTLAVTPEEEGQQKCGLSVNISKTLSHVSSHSGNSCWLCSVPQAEAWSQVLTRARTRTQGRHSALG